MGESEPISREKVGEQMKKSGLTNEIDNITYCEVKYPIKHIFVQSFGNIPISTTVLNSALVDSFGNYTSTDAAYIDERVCYYVEPDEFFMGESELRCIIEQTPSMKTASDAYAAASILLKSKLEKAACSG